MEYEKDNPPPPWALDLATKAMRGWIADDRPACLVIDIPPNKTVKIEGELLRHMGKYGHNLPRFVAWEITRGEEPER